MVVYCTTGYRSAIAASVMRQVGIESISDLVGGLDAWDAAELATAA
jgi:rhodanese-related sulfurtransferase